MRNFAAAALTVVLLALLPAAEARGFWLVGHRGVVGIEDENTIPALELALARGANALEFDVRMTRDGELVLMHDATVNRTTNGRGRVREMTVEEFSALRTPNGHRPPTLDEVLAVFADRELTLFIEVKDSRPQTIAPLVRSLERNRGAAAVVVFAIDAGFLAEVKKRAPWVKVFLAPIEPFSAVERALKHDLDGLLVIRPYASSRLVKKAHGHGLPVVVSMVMSSRQAARLVELGVDGVLVDDPEPARDLVP